MSVTSEDTRKKQLEMGIRRHLLTNDIYHFRPMIIDGINVYIVLYGKYKILNVESIYISCNATVGNIVEKQQYSLYHYQYKSIEGALKKVERINREYRIYNGELVSANCYKMLKLEECVLPYSENESCSVCYENTSDITSCGHSICLSCRETCLVRQKPNCPVCREINALELYSNKSGLVNNQQYSIVKKAIHNEKMHAALEDFIPFAYHDDPGDEDEGDEGDEGDEDEGNEGDGGDPGDREEEGDREGDREEEGEHSSVVDIPNNTDNISDIQNDSQNTILTDTSFAELYQIVWTISRTPGGSEDPSMSFRA